MKNYINKKRWTATVGQSVISLYNRLKIKVAEVWVLRTIPIKTAEGAREILAWYWIHYYIHLSYNNIEDLLSEFNIASENETLNELSRRASQLLYARSLELGWRKMTIRERIRCGFDGSAWQRIAVVEERMSKTG